MLASVGAFVEYFDGVNRRAIRDVGMLPAEAENWTPPGGEGEKAWTIGRSSGTWLRHVCTSSARTADRGGSVAPGRVRPTRASGGRRYCSRPRIRSESSLLARRIPG